MKRTLLALLVATVACGPNYQNGKTKCSVSGTCPSGFVCGTSGVSDMCIALGDSGCKSSSQYMCSPGVCVTSKSYCARVGVDASTSSDRDGSSLDGGGGTSVDLSMDVEWVPDGSVPADLGTKPDSTSVGKEVAGDGGSGGTDANTRGSGGVGGSVVSSGGIVGAGGIGNMGGASGSGGAAGAPGSCAATPVTSVCQTAINSSTTSSCGICMATQCCGQLSACVADTTCETSTTGPIWNSLLLCTSDCCHSACMGGDAGAAAPDASLPDAAICNEATCPGSCCKGNVCAVSQSASSCGILGATCGTCGPTGTTVAFGNGKAAGAMTGFGWVALGALDAITDPTCRGEAITAATSYCLGGTQWNSTSALCVSGLIPALAPTNPDYTNNWGINLGVDATINRLGTLGNFGQTLGQSFTSIAITVTGSPLSGLRAQIHRSGDPSGTNYCAAMTSGTAIPLAAFNTKCYDFPPDGVALTLEDVPNIDQVNVQIPSGAAAITVTNLCITGIAFFSGAPSTCAPTMAGEGCMDAGYLNCGSACCPSTLPYTCSATSKCYATETAAVTACGSTPCSTCVAPTNICTPSAGGVTCATAGDLSCDGKCCDAAHPFHCSATSMCYSTAIAAATACGSTACSTCVGS
jgi:hypothetical protein